jgi:misacylated tRNA(Ala) deacylase
MSPNPTIRLYWEDEHCCEATVQVVGIREGMIAFDCTCVYPGGGGQPADEGRVIFANGQVSDVTSIGVDPDGVLWHYLSSTPSPETLGQLVKLEINRNRRLALTRYHTVLHVLNSVALRDYGAWITGVQIGLDYSHIDFKWDGFRPTLRGELEARVNAVLERAHPIRSYYLSEEEFHRRPELLRTLEVKPPVIGGRVRVVEIEGFDAQACGGTHVDTTTELGRLSVFRTENKGRINKRLYVRLDEPAPQGSSSQ